MINQLKNPIVIVSVTTLVLLLNVGGWSATSATKPVSTSDTATNDTLSNSQSNGGAVQTGQNSVAVILLVAMLAGCAVIFAKRRNHFE